MTNIPPGQAFLNKWDVGNLQNSMTKPHGGDGRVSFGETGLNLKGVASKHTIDHPGDFVADVDKLAADMPLPEFKKFVDDHIDSYTLTTYLYHKFPDFFGKWDSNQDMKLSHGDVEKLGGVDQLIAELEDLVKDSPAHAHMVSKAHFGIRNRFYLWDRAAENRIRSAATNLANQNAGPQSTITGLEPAAGQSVPTNKK